MQAVDCTKTESTIVERMPVLVKIHVYLISFHLLHFGSNLPKLRKSKYGPIDPMGAWASGPFHWSHCSTSPCAHGEEGGTRALGWYAGALGDVSH